MGLICGVENLIRQELAIARILRVLMNFTSGISVFPKGCSEANSCVVATNL
jgi:hypothetical protein